jgi:hypothetical protein
MKERSFALTTLCILTITGCFLILLKGMITYAFMAGSYNGRLDFVVVFIDVVYALEFLSCIGGIVGAIYMLKGQKIGLRIYRISSILYISVTAVYAIGCVLTIVGIFIGLFQIIYLLVSIVFLVLYMRYEDNLT